MTPEVEDFIFELNEMLDDEDTYSFARNTLIGIRTTVTATNTVTAQQRSALHNIRESTQRKVQRWDRRYEGFHSDRERKR